MAFDMTRLGVALREGREALGLTQAELATAAGVGVTTIKNLEAGRAAKRWPRSIVKVTRALGWPDSRARAIATGRVDPGGIVVPLDAAAGEDQAGDDEFVRELRGAAMSEDLRAALIMSYRREKAREDDERRERYRNMVRAAES